MRTEPGCRPRQPGGGSRARRGWVCNTAIAMLFAGFHLLDKQDSRVAVDVFKPETRLLRDVRQHALWIVVQPQLLIRTR